MYRQFQYKVMFVTLVTFLLLNAFLPHPKKDLVWKHLRKVYLVTQTLWFYLISDRLADTEQLRAENRALYFGLTFLFLYFFHTHEFVGERD